MAVILSIFQSVHVLLPGLKRGNVSFNKNKYEAILPPHGARMKEHLGGEYP